MLSQNLREAMLICSILTQERMSILLPNNFPDSKIVDAMRYSALSAGKRIRPFLAIASAQIFGIPPVASLNSAVAIEFIHNYSLIHDDLPAMDNDDFRRGKPTLHKKYDEATAILAGDALLTYAFEILSDTTTHQDPYVRCELIRVISYAAGFSGMVGGQMIDLELGGKKISKEELAKLHRLKTSELFMAACEIGAILGKASLENRNALRYYAHDLGLAFQIKDDILDEKQDVFQKTEIDETHHKFKSPSIVDIIGVESAKEMLHVLKKQAIAHLKPFGDKASLLIDLADFIVMRED